MEILDMSFSKKNSRQDRVGKVSENNNFKFKKTWIDRFPLKIITIATMTCFVAGIGSAVYTSKRISDNSLLASSVVDVERVGENLAVVSSLTRQGDEKAFSEILQINMRLSSLFSTFTTGGVINGKDVPPLSSVISDASYDGYVSSLISEQKKVNDLIVAISQNKNDVITLKRLYEQNNAQMKGLGLAIGEFIKQYKQVNIGDSRADEMYTLFLRIDRNLSDLFLGDRYSIEVGYEIVRDIKMLDALLQAFSFGSRTYNIAQVNTSELKDAIRKVEVNFSIMREFSSKLNQYADMLESVKVLTTTLAKSSKDLSSAATLVGEQLTINDGNLVRLNYLTYLLFLLSFLLSISLIYFFSRKEKRVAEWAEQLSRSQNNQAAVDLLKEQLKPITKKDFTKRVYVSDDFVAQIGDSIEKIRLTFSDIVKQVKSGSLNISNGVEQLDNSSKNLKAASDIQSEQVKDLVGQMGVLTAQVDELAQGTWQAERMSLESAQASENGRKLIGSAIDKMGDVKQNVLESTKKMKQASESAQSISMVTDLIKETTKKIKVLAVNAAIHASSAGNAGREFRVVASEVQRLALESSESAAQIIDLVNRMQRDIGAAVSAMATTTQEVVSGAQLTEKAGESLVETHKLSKNVADGISKTTAELEKKSSEMAGISFKMGELNKTNNTVTEAIAVSTKQSDALKGVSKQLNEIVDDYMV